MISIIANRVDIGDQWCFVNGEERTKIKPEDIPFPGPECIIDLNTRRPWQWAGLAKTGTKLAYQVTGISILGLKRLAV